MSWLMVSSAGRFPLAEDRIPLIDRVVNSHSLIPESLLQYHYRISMLLERRLEHLWSPWRMSYIQNSHKPDACIFCTLPEIADSPENLIVYRGKDVYAVLNRYPYTSGHLMIVPYAHQPTLDGLDPATRAEIMEVTTQGVDALQSEYNPQGYNLGINLGEASGAGAPGHRLTRLSAWPRVTGAGWKRADAHGRCDAVPLDALWADRMGGGVGRTAARTFGYVRKVGAPQGRVPANGRARRRDGKCHRKEDSPAHAGEKLKRCGKSAPASRQRGGLANPTRSKGK